MEVTAPMHQHHRKKKILAEVQLVGQVAARVEAVVVELLA
jgi:hypothetical protein